MGGLQDVVVLAVMVVAALAAVAGHMAGRPVMGDSSAFQSTVGLNDAVRFHVQAMEGGYCADCNCLAELVEEVRSRPGQVLRITDLERSEEEYVEVMPDGSTWYPWASRHRVDLASRFGA